MNFAELSFHKDYLGLTDEDLIRLTSLNTSELVNFKSGHSVPLKIEELVRNASVATTNDENKLICHIKGRMHEPNFYTDYIGLIYSHTETLWRHPTEKNEVARDTLAQDSAFTYRLKLRLLSNLGITLHLHYFDDKEYSTWLAQARVIDTLACRTDFLHEELQTSDYDTNRLFLLL